MKNYRSVGLYIYNRKIHGSRYALEIISHFICNDNVFPPFCV